jgi:ferredoxin-NADP reductase/ferredoxin
VAKLLFNDVTYPVRPGESALDALVRGGAAVAFSCRRGSCQTCLMRAVHGDPGPSARKNLRPELADSGHFMPCVCLPEHDLTLAPPDLSQLLTPAVVAALTRMDDRVLRISLEPEVAIACKPGQYINLHRADGLWRSYSVRGLVEEDYFIEIDVQLTPGGQLSPWLHDQLAAGDVLHLQGPLGECHWREEDRGRPLILIGTGTGVAPLHGIARDALRHHHAGGIHLYYGARRAADLYAHQELSALAARGVRYRAVVLDGDPPPGHLSGDLIAAAIADHPDMTEAVVSLCGDPDLVQRARCEAILAGASRDRIRADPFDTSAQAAPRDQQIIAGVSPDPELWDALGQRAGLRAILEGFYAEVYQDPRLSPFFHNVTRDRAIDKQYEFLVDMFTGSRSYFGLKPFNAHHWMIISDALFDYREAMFERHLRAHLLPEPMIRRWARLHELFRREIVKHKPRGLFVDGVEHLHEGFTEEVLGLDGMCDGCGAEIPQGASARLHKRTGQLYCRGCDALTG